MKLNARVLVFVSAFGAVAAANAQDVNYWLAYGDADFANKNSAAVGAELKEMNFADGLGSIKVRLMVTGVKGAKYGAGGTFLGLDWASKNAGNYSNEAAYKTAQTHGVINSQSVVWSKGLAGKDNSDGDTTVDVSPLGSLAYSGAAGAGTTERPIGMWQAYGFGTGLNLFVDGGASMMLGEFTLGIDQAKLMGKGKYGDDANETGLMLFGAASAANRFNYLGATSGTAALRASKKYGLQAVPEPATMVALGGALVAFARRRRSK